MKSSSNKVPAPLIEARVGSRSSASASPVPTPKNHPPVKGMSAWRAHAKRLYNCRLCPGVIGLPVTGIVPTAKIVLIGQAPGPHELDKTRPFAYTAGKRLFAWFATIGINEESFRRNVHIAAVIRCFPGKDPAGGDRVPAGDEIARCASHLEREFRLLRPGLVIAVGTLAAAQFMPCRKLVDVVGVPHQVERFGQRFDLIVLPHPSGRSTWTNKSEHADLLLRSLDLLRQRFQPAADHTEGLSS